jgi:cellulose synthase/poly-beta-1,6-N-acetylglucosamine synthase-like glycosyltransferase
VPAHNEEHLIASTVYSILSALPRGSFVLVVADNCSDATAEAARDAGAQVIERTNPAERGKSYALEFALSHLRALADPPEAVAFVDADSVVSSEFFSAMDTRLCAESSIAQGHYCAGAGATPVARLRRLALDLVHWSRPLGAARLGLPTTLKGNGMAFRWGVIRGGFRGRGITEDAAATLEFAQRGLTVAFEPHAKVTGLMASSYQEARPQDMRWEGGRLALAPRAFASALSLIVHGKWRAAASCLELASPPLTLVGFAAIVGLFLAAGGFGSLALSLAALSSLSAYVGLGLAAARPSRSDLAALLHVPRFVTHKVTVYGRLLRGQPRTWQRTIR